MPSDAPFPQLKLNPGQKAPQNTNNTDLFYRKPEIFDPGYDPTLNPTQDPLLARYTHNCWVATPGGGFKVDTNENLSFEDDEFD